MARNPGLAPAGPALRGQNAHWLSNQLDKQYLDGFVAKVKHKAATDAPKSAASDGVFERTVYKMLSTAPKPHDKMKKGAAPKRDAHSSGKGSKS